MFDGTGDEYGYHSRPSQVRTVIECKYKTAGVPDRWDGRQCIEHISILSEFPSKMISLLSLAAFGLVLLQAHVASFPLAHPDAPRYFQPNPLTRRNLTTNTVERELGPLLSKGTLIFGPSSPAYANATSRWITFVQPMIQVVVEPATEADVSKIVSNIAMPQKPQVC